MYKMKKCQFEDIYILWNFLNVKGTKELFKTMPSIIISLINTRVEKSRYFSIHMALNVWAHGLIAEGSPRPCETLKIVGSSQIQWIRYQGGGPNCYFRYSCKIYALILCLSLGLYAPLLSLGLSQWE